MARSESQVHDSVAPALWLHPRNVSVCLSAERPAPPGRADSRCCARLDGGDCLGWKPNGELCMSPLQRGVLRELVLFQAAQAQLRSLQPAKVGQRHQPLTTAATNRAQAARNATPPIGVIAPSQRSPESASAYRPPENKTIPASISQPDHFRSVESGSCVATSPTASRPSA